MSSLPTWYYWYPCSIFTSKPTTPSLKKNKWNNDWHSKTAPHFRASFQFLPLFFSMPGVVTSISRIYFFSAKHSWEDSSQLLHWQHETSGSHLTFPCDDGFTGELLLNGLTWARSKNNKHMEKTWARFFCIMVTYFYKKQKISWVKVTYNKGSLY